MAGPPRILAVLACVSPLVCAAAIVLWVRSYRHADELWILSSDDAIGMHRALVSESGQIFEADVARRGFMLIAKLGGASAGVDYASIVVWSMFVPIAYAIWKYGSWRERKTQGLCPECGYDLRATPRRCPECGCVAG